MRCWAATVSEERFAGERLYAFDSLVLPGARPSTGARGDGDSDGGNSGEVHPGEVPPDEVPPDEVTPNDVTPNDVTPDEVTPGDAVALVVAGEPPLLFGLGRVRERRGAEEDVTITYTDRLFDEPLAVGDLLPGPVEPGLIELDTTLYGRLAGRVGGRRHGGVDTSDWFVSVALPIEATSRAEAVREFWTYVAKLGPRGLPAFVWPQGDELAMQAFVLGEEANLDPEEE